MSRWAVDVHDGRARYEGTPTRILEEVLRLIPEEPGIDMALRVIAAVYGCTSWACSPAGWVVRITPPQLEIVTLSDI